jgi:[acyl-carrier-protein] S-malonyltransferase
VSAVAYTEKHDARFSKAKIIPLQVSAPFHCALMAPARELMTPLLQAATFRAPVCPVVANATAAINDDARKFAALLSEQITAPVLWTRSMQRLAELGTTVLIEIGPGKVLAGLQKRIDRTINAATEVFNLATVADLKNFLEKKK